MNKATFHTPVISIFLFIYDSRLTELTSETDWLDTNTIMLSSVKQANITDSIYTAHFTSGS
jgi:hypothetical protein